MKKTIAFVLALGMIFALAACGSNGDTGDNGSNGASDVKTETVTGEVVSAAIPDGWCLISSTELNGASGADYIYHVADKADIQIGDAYMQVTEKSDDLEEVKDSIGDDFGEELDPITTGDITWYGREKAVCAQIGDSVIMVSSYECDFSDAEVQAILGSIALK